MKILELFSGYGTASFALKRLGIPYECVGYSDIDKYANQCFKQNHGGKELGDVRKINPLELEDFDLLTAGFPCQSFSNAGKMLGEVDSRGTLFYEIIRIAEVKKPKYMLLENVKGLTCKKFKPTFDKILNELNRIGYNVYWKVLNSKDYGIPQSRARVWFVCFRKDIDIPFKFQFPQPVELKLFIKDILEKEVDSKYYLSPLLQERFAKYLEEKGKSDLLKENISPRRVRDLQKSDSFITSWELNLFGEVTEKEKEVLECWRFNHRSTKYGYLSVGNGMTKEEIEEILKRDISIELKTILEKGYLILKGNKLYSQNCRKIQGQAGFGFLIGNNSYSPTITCATLTENAVCDNGNCQAISVQLANKNRGQIPYNPENRELTFDINKEPVSFAIKQAQHEFLIYEAGRKELRTHEEGITPTLKNRMGTGGNNVPMIANCLDANMSKGITPEGFYDKSKRNIINQGILRRLTPKECFRLMGFLNDEINLDELSDTQKYKLAGNGQDVNMVSLIFKEMFK